MDFIDSVALLLQKCYYNANNDWGGGGGGETINSVKKDIFKSYEMKQIYNHLSGILIALCKQIAALYQLFIAWRYMLSKVIFKVIKQCII